MNQDENNTPNSKNSGSPSSSNPKNPESTSGQTESLSIQKNENTRKSIKNKKSGIIRWSGIIPFVIFIALAYSYFFFFFDNHMKNFIEWAGYKALGTEINLDHFESSFLKGNFNIDRIQITDTEKPQFNSLEINEVRFEINMDALLRLKFVIEEMAVDGIQFASKRKFPGKIAPPEPPSEESGPSLLEQVQSQAINKVEGKYQNNILGDIAGFLKSGDGNQQLKNIEDSLKSKKLAEELKTKWIGKQTEWTAKIKQLPTDADFKSYKFRFDAIKYKDFKTPQELDASIKDFNKLKSDVDDKIKFVDSTKNDLNSDLKAIQTDASSIDQQIKSDISSLKDRMKIPKLDAGNLTKSLFMDYLRPYFAKVDRYKSLAKKYLPPRYANMLEKESREKQKDVLAEENLVPHAREKGTTYEFPIKNGYPIFWIKKIAISSKSNQNVDFGDLSGKITDLTSNQRQINKVTKLELKGDFKSQKLLGINIEATLNNLKAVPEVNFQFGYGQLPMDNIQLIQSGDSAISIPTTSTNTKITGSSIGFKTIDLAFNFNFNDVKFASQASDKTVNEILTKTLSQINKFDLNGGVKGEISKPEISLNSSLGSQLEAAFQNLLKEKIEEANRKVREEIEKEVAKHKAEFEKVKTDLTNQVNAQIKVAQDQLENQKKLAESRVEEAKKDLENQAKKKAEGEGKKAIEDLKKKLGF